MVSSTPLPPPFFSSATEPRQLNLAGKHVHFVGIGGSGMSGLARLVQHHGALCTGSDTTPGPAIDALRSEGFTVSLEQTRRSLPASCDLVVASAAIRPDHPELTAAHERDVAVLKYAQLLGLLMLGRIGVAVAGTHGKSTTTSILSHVLIQAGLDPSFIVGANCRQIGGGSRCGGESGQAADPSGSAAHSAPPSILVAEACEYDRSFHNFHPTHAVILNVEEDHLDCYSSLEAIIESFATFARKLPKAAAASEKPQTPNPKPETSPLPGGFLLINHEMPHRLAITAGLDCAVETIGFAPQADWRVEIVTPPAQPETRNSELGTSRAPRTRLHHRDAVVAEWASPLPGDHMAYNAAAAAILAHRLGADWPTISRAVAGFQGLDRRMQLIGTREFQVSSFKSQVHQAGSALEHLKLETRNLKPAPITIVDDYGHHPTEVDTTLRALRQHYRPHRLICIFQPHQHSRTRFLMKQFAASFSAADIVIVPHIYFVRDSEQERHAVTAGDLVDHLRQKHVQAMHLYPFEAIVEQLQVITRPGDLVVTMGAGDVWKIAYDFFKADLPADAPPR